MIGEYRRAFFFFFWLQCLTSLWGHWGGAYLAERYGKFFLSVTWVLVSLCASMLIFNLFFVFGIENSNKNIKTSNSETNNTDLSNNVMLRQDTVVISNPRCTAIAILLHYFGLATFVWMGLSAAQLYFLLIRTMKPLPQHFILFNSLIGWGKCLLLHFLRNLILLKSFNLNKHLLKT